MDNQHKKITGYRYLSEEDTHRRIVNNLTLTLDLFEPDNDENAAWYAQE